MSVDIFDPEKSDRAEILYAALEPHLAATDKILDIGCGHAPLAKFIRRDFPTVAYLGFDSGSDYINYCKSKYPEFQFVNQGIYFGHEMDAYLTWRPDVVIHIGVDSWQYSNIWKIHSQLFNICHNPRYVLLEVGWRKEYEGPLQAYELIRKKYESGKYKLLDSGEFEFSVAGHHLKERRWSLWER